MLSAEKGKRGNAKLLVHPFLLLQLTSCLMIHRKNFVIYPPHLLCFWYWSQPLIPKELPNTEIYYRWVHGLNRSPLLFSSILVSYVVFV